MFERFLMTVLGMQQIILGYPWLERTNPKINWKKKNFLWWEEDKDQPNIYALIQEAIEGDVYKETEDLVISYLGYTQHKINN